MKIKLDIFEGPLDLLLYLIKRDHLNVYDIPIANVVDQYLQFLDLMKLLDINVASEYLVTAANLINIKSKMLLPREEEAQEPEGDPREELVRKLLEYEKFKEAADFFREKEQERNKYFRRPVNESQKAEAYIEASIFDLINAFKSALKDIPKDMFFEVVKYEFTVEEKVHDILHYLVEKPNLSLSDLFNRARNKIEIIAMFLAILELIRLKEIVILQKELFGEIRIIRNRENIKAHIAMSA